MDFKLATLKARTPLQILALQNGGTRVVTTERGKRPSSRKPMELETRTGLDFRVDNLTLWNEKTKGHIFPNYMYKQVSWWVIVLSEFNKNIVIEIFSG